MSAQSEKQYFSLYWRWQSAIPKSLCEELKSEFKLAELNNQVSEGLTYINDPLESKKQRDCEILRLKTNHWAEGVLYNHARYANQAAGWDYKIDTTESVQLARYKANQFYNWHYDEDMISHRNGKNRKLTAIIMLSENAEYQGGLLRLKDDDETQLLINQGDLIVFPSHLEHRVEAVTSGTRMTATMWVQGDKFK